MAVTEMFDGVMTDSTETGELQETVASLSDSQLTSAAMWLGKHGADEKKNKKRKTIN